MFHLEKEDKGIVGTNIRDLFKICKNLEERNVIFEGILGEMLKILSMLDKEKFPKRGVLFFISELEDYYKRWANSFHSFGRNYIV